MILHIQIRRKISFDSDTESIVDQHDPTTTDRKGNKIVTAVILLQHVIQDRVQKRSESYLL